MKNLIKLLTLIVLLSTTVQAQTEFADDAAFRSYLSTQQKKQRKLWKKKDFNQAIPLLNETYEKFKRHAESGGKTSVFDQMNILYNLACAYSLEGETEKAVNTLKEVVKKGYSNYLHLMKDSDLNSIRNHPEFEELAQTVRLRGDYPYTLKMHDSYSTEESVIPNFTYQDMNSPELVAFRKEFELDKVAGDGDEVSQIINLMKWVHKRVAHDGGASKPVLRNGPDLINLAEKEELGMNCRMLATILNDAYLAMGFKARHVTGTPMKDYYQDTHVINMVYSNQLQKWLYMDPSFEVYFTGENGDVLSIREVRDAVINGREIVANGLNWNGKRFRNGAFGVDQKGYINYMTKNLFRFSCPLESRFNFETDTENRRYVSLFPKGYKDDQETYIGTTSYGTMTVYYTHDADQFWKAPEIQNN